MRRPWIRALHAALSGLLVGLLAAGPAVAQVPLRLVPQTIPAAAGAPKVVVLAVGLDPAASAQAPWLAHLAERAVVDSGRFELVDLAQVLDAEGVSARQAKAAEAEAAFKDGLKAYDELDTEKALQQFDKAARAYEASDLRVHFAGVSRARVMKVASQVANGEMKAAELEAEAVLAMDPRAKFSPNYFPPEFVTFVEKARQGVLSQSDGAFEVRTGNVPARLYVNGEYQGVTPAKVSGVTRADHYVTLVAPGYAVTQGRARDGEVDFTLGPVKAAPRLQAVADRMARDAQGPGRDAAALELGNFAGSQQVLVVLARGGTGKAPMELTVLRVDGVDGHNWGYATGIAPAGEGLEEAVQALLAGVVEADTPRAGGKPVTHFGSGKPSVARRTTGYVLLATGVALLAGGVYFGLEASSRADSVQRMAQTDARSNRLRDEGQTFALIADVGMVAGLASAGVGTWLAFFGGGGSGGGKSGGVKKTAAKEPPPPPPSPEPMPARKALPMPPPPKAREPEPTPASTEPSKARAEEERKAREDAARREREEEEKRQREEAARRELEVQRKREEEEARRQREQEEQRKREEEKKKRPSIDDDDLRNY